MVRTKFLLLFVPTLAACTLGPQANSRRLTFEDDPVGSLPAQIEPLLTGTGQRGVWTVIDDAAAPSGAHVLRQTDADPTEKRFPLAIISGPPARDIRIRTRCRAVSGDVDRACGVVVRCTDADNYYVARANAVENNIRLYHFVGGVRTQIAGWSGPVTAGVWHELSLEALGDRLRVGWDGQIIMEQVDATISVPGRAGLWTKADSVSDFDDVEVTPL